MPEVVDPKVVLAADEAARRLQSAMQRRDERVVKDLRWSREFNKPLLVMTNDGCLFVGTVKLLSEIRDIAMFSVPGEAAFKHVAFDAISAIDLL